MLQSKKKKGITLIEMLVVIAIIAILVSIISPIVGRSVIKAAGAANAANLRAIEGKISVIKTSNMDAFDRYLAEKSHMNSGGGWDTLGIHTSTEYAEDGVITYVFYTGNVTVDNVPVSEKLKVGTMDLPAGIQMGVYQTKQDIIAFYEVRNSANDCVRYTKDDFAIVAETGDYNGNGTVIKSMENMVWDESCERGVHTDQNNDCICDNPRCLKDAHHFKTNADQYCDVCNAENPNFDPALRDTAEQLLCAAGAHSWKQTGSGNNKKHTCTRSGCTASGSCVDDDGDDKCDVCGNDGCVTPDTLITLADGSTKRVDELNGTEMLLVWNHITGEFTSAPVAYVIDHDKVVNNVEVITLTFSDGNFVKIVSEHVFFDADLGKYVAITSANADTFVGHSFAAMADGKMHMTKLVSVDRHMEETEIYEVITNKTLTCFTNNVLSASAFIDGLLNVFEVDTDTMAFNADAMNADIEKYGLTNYAFFAPFVSREMFDMHNGEYMAVAMGKNVLSLDDIMGLIDLYNLYVN